MRSKLFVPGVRPELFPKALAGEADAISLDLEDAVPEAGKSAARAQVAALLRSEDARASGKHLIVRTNGFGSPHLEQDLAQVVVPGLDTLNIPKIESAQQVLQVAAWLDALEPAAGIARPLGLLLNIETPRGLRMAAELAGAHPRVRGLQLGLADLYTPYGIARDTANVHAAMHALRMAAAEAGIVACDAAYPDVTDDAGFLAEAEMAARLGFVGKSCVHPRQVALANRVFRPDPDQVAQARRIVAAAVEAEREGRGAFLLDGQMVDLPYLRRAQALLSAVAAAGTSA